MLYGLYLSASGMISSAYKQDVVANNLANSESVGFKRDVASFQERLTEAQQRRLPGRSNAMLEMLGGGIFAKPTLVDSRQGEIEPTGNALDVAIEGDGYFGVTNKKGESRLTRNGQFAVNKDGHLILSNGEGQAVLDPKGQPIRLLPNIPVSIAQDGTISQTVGQRTQVTGRIGLFDVADPSKLTKKGGTLIAHPGQPLIAGKGLLRSEFVERANVDPATELSDLMETQRQLEANANMIRYQDQTLGRLVNEVGKIS
jgi:flagellar basal body rod protein FlgG